MSGSGLRPTAINHQVRARFVRSMVRGSRSTLKPKTENRLVQRGGELTAIGRCQRVVVPKHAEDVHHRLTGVFLPLSLSLHNSEEPVESGFELRTCRQPPGKTELSLVIIWIGRCGGF